MARKRRFELSTTQIILLSFLLAILAGSLLLSLPIATRSGQGVPYIDALFMATTATCVTGLVTSVTLTTWSIFGQAVILLLIQIGGLGIITVMAGLMVAINRKMGLRDSLLIQDSFNLSSLSGLAKFVKRVILGTFIVEGLGALMYMPVFVRDFGLRGIWVSVFNSISAFCNAGIDIIGDNSLCNYATSPLVNGVTMMLIITGGIGFIVWWDLIRVWGDIRAHRGHWFRRLTLHSKVVLTSTAVLIFGGALAILAFEYNNPATIGEMSLFDKIQASLFQSVTTRTAGFAAVPQENLTNPSAILSLLLMFIGGSPVGTAGGIKTVTMFVLIATAISATGNRSEVTLFQRRLSVQVARKAVAVCGMSFAIMFLSTVLLSAATDARALDIVYETVSATATVGLSRGITPTLDLWGKLIIIFTMYFGRIGPVSLAVAFQIKNQSQNSILDPIEDIAVG